MLSFKKYISFKINTLSEKKNILLSLHLSVFYIIIITFLGAFYVLENGLHIIKFIVLIALGDRYCDYPYFTDDEVGSGRLSSLPMVTLSIK